MRSSGQHSLGALDPHRPITFQAFEIIVLSEIDKGYSQVGQFPYTTASDRGSLGSVWLELVFVGAKGSEHSPKAC